MSRTASQKSVAKGFTLIELLIVIGIIGILAAIILVAVDPAKRLKQSRNARRSAEANAILNAILNYTVDFKGALPAEVLSATTGQNVVIGSQAGVLNATICPGTATGGLGATTTRDLAANTALVDAYISSLPIDPRGVNDAGDVYSSAVTGYFFNRSANGRIEVGSCNPEDEGDGSPATIKIKR